MAVSVFDLEKGEHVATYDLNPVQALVAAWHQHADPHVEVEGVKPQGYNTWAYDKHPAIFVSDPEVAVTTASRVFTIADRFTCTVSIEQYAST